MTLAEIQELTASTDSKLIEQTQSKPYKGQEWQPGTVGGTWNTSILADPKTFNHLIAERDADSAAIIGMTTDYLVDYDMFTRQWIPHAASFEIETDLFRTFVDMFGARHDGIRATFQVEEKPGMIAKLSNDIAAAHGNIVSLVTFDVDDASQRRCTLKVTGIEREKFEQILKESTLEVEDIR